MHKIIVATYVACQTLNTKPTACGGYNLTSTGAAPWIQ